MTVKPEYPVVLRPLSPEDGGGWIAIVPDLPGCMSDGKNAYEALESVTSAIDEWKEAARAMGRPVPAPDASLESTLEQEVPDHIRRQAQDYARQMFPAGSGDVDQGAVHAIIAEWARAAAHRIRL
jgi:antitoxin HicB